jgi:hypothetical protein
MGPPHVKLWRRLVVPTLLVCLAGLAGCGPRGPDVQYVEGVVTLAGKPLEHATVTFFPVGDGLGAAGITDKDGRYRLNSPRARPTAGALIGDYSITVTKYDDLAYTFRPAPTDPEGFARWQTELSEHVRKQEGKTPPLLTPEKYSKPEKSPLKATVKKGRNTGPEYSFDLR